MNKIFFFAVAAALLMAGCNPNAQPTDQASTALQQDKSYPARIAYVEIDTLMSQYKLFEEYSKVLTEKGTDIQNTLADKQRTLEQHAQDLQKRYERNEFTTRDQLENAQAKIQKEQAELQELAEKLNAEFNMENARYHQEALDSIHSFLNAFKVAEKFDFVLMRSAGDNFLYANPALDITAEVVEGLNKNYKAK